MYSKPTSSIGIHQEAPYTVLKTWNTRRWSNYKWKLMFHMCRIMFKGSLSNLNWD